MLRKWISRRRGGFAVLTAVASVPMVISIGLAVDYTRISAVHAELQRGVDAAAIAGARVVVGYPRNDARVIADARSYFWANVRDHFTDAEVVGGQPRVTVIEPARDAVKVEAAADLPLMFGAFLGVSSFRTHAKATAQRYTRGMELVLALDTTNSMSTARRLPNLKRAAADLLDIVYGATENERTEHTCLSSAGTTRCGEDYSLLVGIVPFVATVNVMPERGRAGSALPGFVDPAAVGAIEWGGANSWKGCVMARPYPYEEAQADAPPSTMGFTPYAWRASAETVTWGGVTYAGPNYWRPTVDALGRPASVEAWPDSGVASARRAMNRRMVGWGNGQESGPNRGCGYPILPLQPFKDVAKNTINALQVGARNGTTASLGMAWSWRLLSPAWRSYWEGATWSNFAGPGGFQSTVTPVGAPHDYDDRHLDKVVVLFTDGQNEMGSGRPVDSVQACCTNAYGDWSTQPLGASPVETLNRRTVEVCNAMKAKGVKVFVILLYNAPPRSVLDTFNENGCASGPNYFFNSPDGSDLRRLFREVGAQLSNLRLID